MQTKRWVIEYDHKDGRAGTVEATTDIVKVEGQYGNGKSGSLSINGYDNLFDLRYCTEDDLHMAMINQYFGNGLVKAVEK